MKKFQIGNVITISLGHMFHDIYTSFLAPILPLLIQNLGISMYMAGLLDVFRKLPSLFNPFVGIIADKICVRYFVILAPAFSAIGMSLLGLAPSYTTIALLLFAVGISNTMFHVPAPVMIKQVSGYRVGKGMSYFMVGGEISRTLGPLLITAAISFWGLQGSWRVMPIGILASVFLYFKLRNVRVNDSVAKPKETHPKDTLRKLMPVFGIVLGITFFRTAMKLALTLYLPTFLTNQGNSLWIAGISLAILQFSGAIGTFFAGSISDKIGRKQTLLIASIINPILMWLFLISNEFFKIPLLILIGFFLFAFGPVLLAFVQDTDSEYPAFVNGIYMTINFGVSSIMAVLIGLGGDFLGLSITYKICLLLALGTIPFVLKMKNEKRESIIKNH
ncbi:MAG: MFS transporter [Candidatus Cloacimonetes bacterium]|nr:MFS transporter [Candidatus Cloacimonadota bacterium]